MTNLRRRYVLNFIIIIIILFFFSSRRRHTRYSGDWSSDVCSSDLALILMDLDGFKTINDTYGHQAGDTILKEEIGRASCRERV
mgnify:CR=1 FL=1